MPGKFVMTVWMADPRLPRGCVIGALRTDSGSLHNHLCLGILLTAVKTCCMPLLLMRPLAFVHAECMFAVHVTHHMPPLQSCWHRNCA